MRESFLPLAKPSITDVEVSSVSEVLKSGHLTTGPKVTEFESGMCGYIGRGTHAVALNSCTAGLHLSLVALGIGKGDEVIVPTWTFAATGHVVLWTGAKVVLCDVEEETLNIDAEKAASLITPRTKAIMPVHFGGYPCDMDGIDTLARRHRLHVVEDAAHAAGALYRGRKIGDSKNVAVFSFYATKNLTCGEGGMAVSRNGAVIEKIRKLSYFGISKEAFSRYEKRGNWYYEIEGLGYKYNMDSIHAAIGLVQLKRLDTMNKRRRQIAALYRKNFDRRIRLPVDDPENYHIYHLFPVRVNRSIIPRDVFIRELKERNIGTSVHFMPLHKHPFYKRIARGRSFPVSDSAYEEIVSIPMFPDMSDEDVFFVIKSVNEILRKKG